jgi:hypothetical protein
MASSIHQTRASFSSIALRENSKKPPHLRQKFAKPSVFDEITKNHQF